ncbi:MAG: SPOR domain-containing protein [Burkholderiaceae bacterium]|nr:SPOR domain-containing protein [Burkholderiaceae bacterium]
MFWSKKKSETPEVKEPSMGGSNSEEKIYFPNKEPSFQREEIKFSTESHTIEKTVSEQSAQEEPVKDSYSSAKRISLRRRLIGAVIILVALLVSIPFFLDREAPPPTITVPLTIPSEGSVSVTQIMVPGHDVNQKKVVVAPEKKTVAVKKETVVKPPKVVEVSEKSTEKPKTIEKQRQESPKKVESKKEKVEPKKELKQESEKKTTLPKGSYVIQLIATSDKSKAQALKKKVSALGLPVYTEEVSVKKGKITRVRVGPFKSAKMAEEARAQLGMVGISSGYAQQVK